MVHGVWKTWGYSGNDENMGQLTLRYQYDASFFDPGQTTDDLGWLAISASSARFSGEGGFWARWQDVKNFGEALSTVLITSDHPIKVDWGFNKHEGNDLILGIEISRADGADDLVVQFNVADYLNPGIRIRGHFLTNRSDLGKFGVSISRLMHRESDEATLIGKAMI